MSVTRPLLALLAALLLLPAGAEAKSHPTKKSHRKHAAKRMKAPGKDRDGDGISNRYEKLSKTNPRKPDSDGDGLPDGREDRDGDGVNNKTEQLARTLPGKQDSNRNGVADGAEDPDRDGLPNRGESTAALHPRMPDSDLDGVLDGDENAGTVTAVGDHTLTIALAKGGDLIARWDEDTDILCAGSEDAGSDESDDDSGSDDADEDDADDDDPDSSADDDEGDDASDDEGDDADLDRARTRSTWTAASGCMPAAGDFVYEAEVGAGGTLLDSLDLLGA